MRGHNKPVHFLQGVWKSWRKRNVAKEKIPQMFERGAGDELLHESVYERKPVKWRHHLANFNSVHYVFKYKLLVPLIYVAEWALGKALVKNVSEARHDEYLKCFNTAWDDALTDTISFYGFKQGKLRQRLKLVKQLVLTLVWYDNAYRNWLACFCNSVTNTAINAEGVDLQVFDTAFEQSCEHWTTLSLRRHRSTTDKGHQQAHKRYTEEHPNNTMHLMRTIKKMVSTSALNHAPFKNFLLLFLAGITRYTTENIHVHGRSHYIFYTRGITKPARYYKLYQKLVTMKDEEGKETKEVKELLEPVNPPSGPIPTKKGLYNQGVWKYEKA